LAIWCNSQHILPNKVRNLAIWCNSQHILPTRSGIWPQSNSQHILPTRSGIWPYSVTANIFYQTRSEIWPYSVTANIFYHQGQEFSHIVQQPAYFTKKVMNSAQFKQFQFVYSKKRLASYNLFF
jgi:hypothetical protein